MDRLEASTLSPAPAAQPVPPPKPMYPEASIVEPPKFSGKISKLKNFITKCELAFNLCPSTFRNDHMKVLFMLRHLVNNAFQWAYPITKNRLHSLCFDYPIF